MRTTVSIEDSLLDKVRQASLERNCSLGEVFEDALRATLMSQHQPDRARTVRPLKTFGGSGLQPGVDLFSTTALLEVMEGR